MHASLKLHHVYLNATGVGPPYYLGRECQLNNWPVDYMANQMGGECYISSPGMGGTRYYWGGSETPKFPICHAVGGKAANPRMGWIRQELIIDKGSVGILGYRTYSDRSGFEYNGWAFYIDNVPNFEWEPQQGGSGWDPRSIMIGGFYRREACAPSGHYTSDDAFRYFDDIYIDTSLARVMLANNSNYNQATIVEPQIPSAWSSNFNYR